MSLATVVTFLVVGGLVWGGFIVFASIAIRKEGARTEESETS